MDQESKHNNTNGDDDPLSRASLWARFWFAWNKPLLDLGCQRPLEASDLPKLAKVDQSRANREYIEALWHNEQEECRRYNNTINTSKKKRQKPSLARAMARDYVRTTWKSRLLIMLNSLSKIGQALALGILLEQFEKEDDSSSSSSSSVTSSAYFWAAVIIACGCVAFPTKQHSFFDLYRKGSQYRVGLMAAIYAKTLRLPSIRNSSSDIGTSGGHVTNLASNDVERFLLTSIYANLLLASPLEIMIILVVGIYTIGPVFCCGYALLLVLVPLQFWLSRRFVVFRSRIAKLTDARATLVSQAITGARVLKLQGWELELERKISSLRAEEVQQLQTTNRLKAWNDAIYYVSSLAVAVFVLGVYVGFLGGTLTPRIVFTTFTLWNLLQYSVTKHIPHAIMGLSECYVACRRIQTFLELPERQQQQGDDGEGDSEKATSSNQKCQQNEAVPRVTLDDATGTPLIQFSNATCYWDGELETKLQASKCNGTVALDNISLSFEAGKLYCVIGKVGSGKSALLQALIGELPLSSGEKQESYTSISYAAQDPWVMDGTARENICMGLDFNDEWYNKVVKACCLESDFEIFLQGDQTIVGDRGVQCSGGQKARLALARAIYCDAQVIVLDDPLSAVDTKVARSIYYSAIQELGVQRDKCVVLVTHQHQFVGANENICILLDQGKLICFGSFADCVATSGGTLSDALQTEEDEMAKENQHNDAETQAVDGSSNQSVSKEDKDDSFVERRATGVIKSRTWLSYGEALGGMLVSGLFLAVFTATQANFLVTMTFVGKWAEAADIDQNSSYWFSMVYGLTAGTVVLAILRAQVSFYLFLRASKRLHNQMLRSVLRATIEFYDTNPLGRILNRFSADVGIVDELLPFTIYDFGVGFIMFVGSIITAIVILPLTLVVFPFLLWVFVRLKGIFVQTTRELKRLEGLGRSPIYAMMSESLSGIATIRANQKTVYFCNKYEALHDTLIQAQFAFIGCSRWFATKLDFLSFVFLTTATLCAVIVQDQGWLTLDPAVLGLALSLLLQLAGANFPFMVRQSAEVTNHMVSVERLWEFGHNIPQEAPLITGFDQLHQDWPKNSSIQVKNLQARYRANLPPCLRDVSFNIQPGERVGVVGRTGAGKTSLLQALFRVLEAEEGSIHIGGVDISQLGLHKLRTNMAVITQSPVLFSGCTIRENLDPYPKASGKEELHRLETALQNVHMWDSIQSLPDGLETVVAEGGLNFSVGQRQLLCLARACLADSHILVLDEATANVDQRTDSLLQQTLRERFHSATIIAIAHRLDTVMDYDKVLVLGTGQVLEFGSPSDLLQMEGGSFASMVESTGTAMAELLKQKVKKDSLPMEQANKIQQLRRMGGKQPMASKMPKKMRGTAQPSVATILSLLFVLLLVAFPSNASSSVIINEEVNHSSANIVVGLSFRNDAILPPHPLATTAEIMESTVLVMTCHFVPAESTTTAAPTRVPTPSQCCAAMMQAAKGAKEKEVLPPIWAALLSEISHEEPAAAAAATASPLSCCEAEGSRVPQQSPPDDDGVNINAKRSHSLCFTYHVGTNTKMVSRQGQSSSPRRSSNNNNNLYVWNDSDHLGVWLDDLSLEVTLPSWVIPFVAPAYSPVLESRGIPVDFRSVLSPTGGMHRLLDHTLAIPLEDISLVVSPPRNKSNDRSIPQEQRLSLEASFLLVLPNGMFMDAEDAFEEHRWSVALMVPNKADGLFDHKNPTNIPLQAQRSSSEQHGDTAYELSLHSEKRMDIEQPAFDSPQHAVLVALKWWTATSTNNHGDHENNPIAVLQRAQKDPRMQDASLVFGFATKIHLRYPSPVNITLEAPDDKGGVSSSLYRPVLLLPPTWVSGHLRTSTQNPYSEQVLQLYGSSPWHLFGYEAASLFASNHGSSSTATWVASASQDDFVLVAVLTVLFSLLGALMLGYETSKIAQE